jgi:hypothetical protein
MVDDDGAFNGEFLSHLEEEGITKKIIDGYNYHFPGQV